MLVLGTLMIPDQLRLVPLYQMLVNMLPKWVSHVGWHNASFVNRNGVILISLVSAASLFLMRQYFLTIPRDLEEAAKLDGAGYFKTYWRVMLPLAGPALAAVAILTFQGSWNSLFWPAVLLQSESQHTIPLGLTYFQQVYTTLWPQLMAASVTAILPILVLFVFFQRYFVAQGRFTAGVATKYASSMITADAMFQQLAEGFPVGMRFHSAPVVRLADAKPLQLWGFGLPAVPSQETVTQSAERSEDTTSQASAPARWPRPPLTARRPPLPAHSCQRPAATPVADQQTASASSNEDRPPQPGRDL